LFEDIDDKLLIEDERVELATWRPVNDRDVQGLTVAQFVRMKELRGKGTGRQPKEIGGDCLG
jgi:hypothetical protein